MRVNGTLVNYYFHCKRQCYLHGNRMNLEDNSEIVQVGKALHEERAGENKNAEIEIDNIRIDKLTAEYLTEVKKTNADEVAARWQLYYYLYVLKSKGIERKGKLEFFEKGKNTPKTVMLELTSDIEEELKGYMWEIEELLKQEVIPEPLNKPKCKKCAYYEYCYI